MNNNACVRPTLTLSTETKKLYAFLRSPVWITTGFGAKYAGPGGTNFNCQIVPDYIEEWLLT
jgi:hypothetical protein